MSQQSKRELVRKLHPRYLQASLAEKTKILDEFVAVTGLWVRFKSSAGCLEHLQVWNQAPSYEPL